MAEAQSQINKLDKWSPKTVQRRASRAWTSKLVAVDPLIITLIVVVLLGQLDTTDLFTKYPSSVVSPWLFQDMLMAIAWENLSVGSRSENATSCLGLVLTCKNYLTVFYIRACNQPNYQIGMCTYPMGCFACLVPVWDDTAWESFLFFFTTNTY